jgi:hypothetical protein
VTHPTDRDRRRPADEGSAFGLHTDDSGVRNHAQGASIIQVGFSERWLVILLIAIAFIALICSILSLVRSSEATALENVVRTNNAKLEVLQYDHQALKAQLIAKGQYESSEH